MNVLVSGSRGFIGAALVARLAAEGHTVHRLVRSEPGPRDALLDLEGRRIDAARLPGSSLESIDAVFHLSGEPVTPWRWSAAKRERIRSSRVVTTDAVARSVAATEGAKPVLVVMSAVGYYGDRGDEVLDEASPSGAGTLADVCRAWEAATAPASDAGARVVNMRTGVVLGPGGGSLRIQVPLFKAGLGSRLGSGRQWVSWISLEDEVGALVHAASEPAVSGPCNATAPAPVRNRELTAALAAAVRRPARLTVPRPLLELVAGVEATREIMCASQRVLPAQLERTGYAFALPSLEGALAVAVATGAGQPGDDRGATPA